MEKYMGWNATTTYQQQESAEDSILGISSLLVAANDLKQAYEGFADYLNKQNVQQLMVAAVEIDNNNQRKTEYPYLANQIKTFDSDADHSHACPVLKMALQLLTPFEALNAAYPVRDEPLLNYVKQMTDLGHQAVGVVPVRLGKSIYVFALGLNRHLFHGAKRDSLIGQVTQFVTAANVRFTNQTDPVLSVRDDSRKEALLPKLSARELEVLEWTAKGKTSYEISIILGLSTHTVNSYVSTACRRLSAATRCNAVAIALTHGMISIHN